MTTKVLILGGGFGGLYAALELERTIARRPDVEVTLVNRDNFFLFTPMLHEVAASDLDLTNIVSPFRKMLRHVNFFAGCVEAIDLARKKVVVTHGAENHAHELDYDHLLMAMGSVTNFYGLPGLEERALTMKSLGDAIHLRNHLIANLEEADFECCPYVREPLLNLVVAGGGFAGVETIAGLNDFVREAVEYYPHLREDMLRIVLVHPGDTILPELDKSLGAYAQQKLAERGVEIRLNSRVSAVTDREVVLSDGTKIVTNTLVWTAGTSPCPLLIDLPCKKERGRVVVGDNLEVEGWPGVWAVGDLARISDRKTGGTYPPTGQHALREGKVAARNIAAAIDGRATRPFSFSTIGQLAAIGRRTGVANILGVNFSGFFAWWLWRTIYLLKLPRFEKKTRVALDWTLDLLFTKDLVQFNTQRGTRIEPALRTLAAERSQGAAAAPLPTAIGSAAVN